MKTPQTSAGEQREDVNEELQGYLPQFEATVRDESIGLLGYVVVDSTVDEHSCGGIRISEDVSVEKLRAMARGMTLKYGFSGMEQGGAKAGIVGDAEGPLERKEQLLRRFGELIAPLLRSRYYISGPDMGITNAQVRAMLAAAGLQDPPLRRHKGTKSGYFTAVGVMVAMEACAEFTGKELSRSTVAIQGFGSVGSALAELLSKQCGAKVVAISNARGALYKPSGLDVDTLLSLGKQYGSDLVHHYPRAHTIALEDLDLLDVDILAPCAQLYSITLANASHVKARVVCPGANNPVSRRAEKVLFERGILSVPYFAANCGGVLGNRMEVLDVDDGVIEAYIRRKNRARVLQLLNAARDEHRMMIDIAEEYALRRFRANQGHPSTHPLSRRLRTVGIRMMNSGIVPLSVVRPFALAHLQKTSVSDPDIR